MAERKSQKQLLRMNAEHLEAYFREICPTTMSAIWYERGDWYRRGEWKARMDEDEDCIPTTLKWDRKEDMIAFFLQYEKED